MSGEESLIITAERIKMAEEEAKNLEQVTEVVETPVTEEKFAKSGKKSKKHIEEVKA